MPRDGSFIYSVPPGTDGVPDRTIDSAKFNAFAHDVEADLNLPRPIIAGGTGATSAAAALANLGGETMKQVVTDFNAAVFVAGSFYAASTAANSPAAGHAFSGICYVTDTSNMFVEARDQDDNVRPGRIYTRQMKAGVWSAWGQDISNAGVSGAAGTWVFNNTSTFPPASGQLRLNNAVQSAATHVYVSHITGTSADVTSLLPSLIQPGGKLYLQEVGVPADYISFNITSVVFTAGDADVTVTVADAGTPIANTANTTLTALSPVGGSMFVRYDAVQTLTVPQQVQARQNIAAAPFDALAFNGIQINGSCEVDQIFAGAATAVGSSYSLDMWVPAKVGTMVVGTQQVSVVAPGYQRAIVMSVNTAQASLAAGDFCALQNVIEGYRVQRLQWGTLNAQPVSIGFWVFANATLGTYSGSLLSQTGASTFRSYAFSFTINALNTWEYKTVTIPGDTLTLPQAGNLKAMVVIISMAVGTTYQTAPGVWTAGTFFGATGTVNGVAVANAFYVTGLIVLPGIELPSAARAPFIMRPFDQELTLCQRYWEKSWDYGTVPGTVSGAGAISQAVNYSVAAQYGQTGHVMYKVRKRIAPTVTMYSPASGVSGKVRDVGNATDVTPSAAIGETGYDWAATMFASYPNAYFSQHFVADARM